MLNKFKMFLARVKRVFTEVEAFAKTAGAAIIGGGINAIVHELHANGSFVFDAEHLMALKASFIGGALTAFFFYLMEFPALKKLSSMASGQAGE